MAWPGADFRAERRRSDWGTDYVNDPDRRSELVTLDHAHWEDADAFARVQGIMSRSPARGFQVKVGGTQIFNLLAVDGTDDKLAAYDGLEVLQARGEGRGPAPPVPLHVGSWQDVPCRIGSPPQDAVCQVKLLELAPDLARVRVYFAALYSIPAFPPAFAQKLATRGLFWTGPPDNQRLTDTWEGRPGIDLQTWTEQSDRFARFFGDLLEAAVAEPDWDLLMGYVPAIGEAGHQLSLLDPRQPGFSVARRDELASARRRVWQSVDRQLARLLSRLDLRTTAVALVSDHGMAPVHTVVDANGLLKEQELLAMDATGKILSLGTVAYAVGSGGFTEVYVAPERRDLLPRLREVFADWSVKGEHPVERMFSRQEAREIGLDHPHSGDLILFAREGFSLSATTSYGMHGYLASHRDMQGIFLALGSGVARGSAGPVRTIDVAGRVAAWLGIEKPRAAM